MGKTLRNSDRLAGAVTGLLCAYAIGRVWGWFFFGPFGQNWVLIAPAFVAAGAILGLFPFFWRNVELPLAITLGLFAGWLVRIFLVREVTPGQGSEFMLAGMILGAAIAINWIKKSDHRYRPAMLGALYGGFLASLIYGAIPETETRIVSLMANSTATLLGAIMGAIAGAWIGARRKDQVE